MKYSLSFQLSFSEDKLQLQFEADLPGTSAGRMHVCPPLHHSLVFDFHLDNPGLAYYSEICFGLRDSSPAVKSGANEGGHRDNHHGEESLPADQRTRWFKDEL